MSFQWSIFSIIQFFQSWYINWMPKLVIKNRSKSRYFQPDSNRKLMSWKKVWHHNKWVRSNSKAEKVETFLCSKFSEEWKKCTSKRSIIIINLVLFSKLLIQTIKFPSRLVHHPGHVPNPSMNCPLLLRPKIAEQVAHSCIQTMLASSKPCHPANQFLSRRRPTTKMLDPAHHQQPLPWPAYRM